MTYIIDQDDCIQCEACIDECPEEAISEIDGQIVIDAAKCADCGSCEDVCPTGAAHAL
jgi:NAD-dependent dihydropyrimidine dehydrogenase PreA subunit